MQATTTGAHITEGIGCSNWQDIKMKAVGGLASIQECEALCHATVGCAHANFQTSECGDAGVATGECYLYGGPCEKEANECWTLADMPPGVHQYRPTDAQTGCANWDEIKLGDAIATSNLFECAAACHDNPECSYANFQSGAMDSCVLGQSNFQGACFLFGGTCEKQDGSCWDLIEMEQRFKGCYKRSADDLDDTHEYMDLTCVDADKFSSTSPCRSGLPWYRKRLEEGQGSSACFDFCLSKGLDLAGLLSVVDSDGTQRQECRCGATSANMVGWHEKEPKESLMLSESMAVPVDDLGCQIRVWEYVGGLEDDGVPWEKTELTAHDIEYLDDISESSRDTGILIDAHAHDIEHSKDGGRRLAHENHSVAGERRLGMCSDGTAAVFTSGETCSQMTTQYCEDYHWVKSMCPVKCGVCAPNSWEPCFPSRCASGTPWPKQDGMVTIPYYFQPGLDTRRKSAFRRATEFFEPTCIRFVESSQRPASAHIGVVNKEKDKCWAQVGYPRDGVCDVNLGFCNDARHIGSMAHELGHAIGMGHEHSRADATQQVLTPDGWKGPYIQIHWDNIVQGWRDQYYAEPRIYLGSATLGHAPYDYNSLMHYDSTASTGKKAISAVDPSKDNLFGNRNHFTESDITKINDIYGCKRQSGVKTEDGEYCVFPFTYGGETYSSCTMKDRDRLWCVTVSVNSGTWGYCPSCTTTNGDVCVFPFVYKGRTYTSCTTKDSSGSPWCFTNSAFSAWGTCTDQCVVATAA